MGKSKPKPVLGDFHLAEDAAQEAFIEAYPNLSKVYGPAAFPSWLRKIIFKHCNRLTRRKRLETVPLEEAMDRPSDDSEPIVALEAQEMKERVLAAIQALPEHERIATTLFYINGYSQNEIAEFLEVPQTTINSRLQSARRRLKATLSVERMIPMVKDTFHEQAPSRDEAFLSELEQRMALFVPCELLNPEGVRKALNIGADLHMRHPDGLSGTPLAMLIGTYNRDAKAKHECMEILIEAGFQCPDTPVMALHRGRLDLLEKHLEQDPQLLHRRFNAQEVYFPEIGVTDEVILIGTPIEGVTLLHLAVEYRDVETAEWLLAHGADINAKADAEGLGGHTPLFHVVGYSSDEITRLLLERGADSTIRATIRHPKGGWGEMRGRIFEKVTPLGYVLALKGAVGKDKSGRYYHEPIIQILHEYGAPE
ncbi:sigma-70 family RNA polymerase sigma factor [Candidatus Poribacteria bacterium]|nr:sigma-70 family RNA polymerase sigma factor [Candidatus Poribacteria bacterium]